MSRLLRIDHFRVVNGLIAAAIILLSFFSLSIESPKENDKSQSGQTEQIDQQTNKVRAVKYFHQPHGSLQQFFADAFLVRQHFAHLSIASNEYDPLMPCEISSELLLRGLHQVYPSNDPHLS